MVDLTKVRTQKNQSSSVDLTKVRTTTPTTSQVTASQALSPTGNTLDDAYISNGLATPELKRQNYESKVLKTQALNTANAQKLNTYNSVVNNPDYVELSTYTPKDTYRNTDNLRYNLINNDEEAKRIQNELNFGSSLETGDYISPMYQDTNLQYMDDSQRGVYNYLYATQGKDQAEEYIQLINPTLNERMTQKTEEDAVKYAQEHPVLSSIETSVSSPLKALALAGQTIDYLKDGSLDTNKWYNQTVQRNAAIREDVTNQIKGDGTNFADNAKAFLYQTGLSMADNLVNIALTGGSGLGKFGEVATLLLMSSGAAADSITEAKESGLSDTRAFTTGLVAGVIEYLTEKMGYDALFDKILKKENLLKYFGQNILAEGFEEGTSDVLNALFEDFYDKLTGEENSQIKREIRELMAGGMSESEASAKVIANWWKQFGLDVLGGAISGGAMAGGGIAASSAINGTAKAISTVNTIRDISNSSEQTNAILGTGLRANPQSQAYSMAQQNVARIEDTGEGLTFGQTYKQLKANRNAITEENKSFKDTIRTVVDQAKENGSVTNKMAESIMENERLLKAIGVDTNLKENEKRTAVKNYINEIAFEKKTNLETSLKQLANEYEETKTESQPNTQTEGISSQNGNFDKVYQGQMEIIKGLGEEGQKAYKELGDTSFEAFSNYMTFYNAGRKSADINKIKTSYSSNLSSEQFQKAYNAGIKDMESSVSSDETANKVYQEGKILQTPEGYEKLAELHSPETYRIVKQLSKDLGVNVEFTASVAEGENNGSYDSETGTIKIAYDTTDFMYSVAKHEFTHRLQTTNPRAYNKLKQMILEQFAEDELTDEIVRRWAGDYNKSEDEIVAYYTNRLFDDEGYFGRIVSGNRKFAETLRDNLREVLYKVKKSLGKNLSYMDKLYAIERQWTKALNESKQVKMPSVSEPLSKALNNNAVRESVKSMRYDLDNGAMVDALVKENIFTKSEAKTFVTNVSKLVDQIAEKSFLDLNEEYIKDNRPFSAWKQNSDDLYKVSLDYSTLCKKRIIQGLIIDKIQEKMKRAVPSLDQFAIRAKLIDLQESYKQLEVACAMCYVESARMKQPVAINKFLDNKKQIAIDYFAQKDTKFKEQCDIEAKKQLGIDPKTSIGSLSTKLSNEFHALSKEYRATDYKPTKAQQTVIDRISKMDDTMFLTQANLTKLANTDYQVYDIFYSNIRNATKSKMTEFDMPYYFGDSYSMVSDSLIKQMNEVCGVRTQSWSDFQLTHLLDNITAICEMSARHAKMHGFTKVLDFVKVNGATGLMINMSLVPEGQTGFDAQGNLKFSPTEGMSIEDVITGRNMFPHTTGSIAIGISDEHIIAMMNDDRIDMIIPYHKSALTKDLAAIAEINDWVDYSTIQSSKNKKTGKIDGPEVSEWLDLSKYDLTKPGIEVMRDIANKYLQVCDDMEVIPVFDKFRDQDNYWKLIVGRKMIDHATGKIIVQEAVKPNFDWKKIGDIISKAEDPHTEQLADELATIINAAYESGEMDAIKKNKSSAKFEEMTKQILRKNEFKSKLTDTDALLADDEQMYEIRYSSKQKVTDWDIDWDTDNESSLKSQLTNHQDEVNSMNVIADITITETSTYKQQLNQILKNWGYKISREDFGDIIFDSKAIDTVSNYVNNDSEAAALIASPYVLKRGKAISGHKNHKFKGYPTVSFAAPVMINGVRGNVVATVLYGRKDRVHAVRILMPDGSEFEFSLKKDGLLTTKGASSDVNSSIGKSSTEDNVSQKRMSVKDSTGRELSKGQQEYFKDSVIRDKDGNLQVVYHGTENEFYTFDINKGGKNGRALGYGFYFTTNKETAKKYGNRIIEAYLDVKKPLSNSEKTMSKSEFAKFVKSMVDYDVEKYKSEGLTWQDGFMSNYFNTYDYSKDAAVRKFVNQVWDSNFNDVDLVFEVAIADGINDNPQGARILYDVLTKSTGYDAVMQNDVIVAFNSNQAKLTTNTNPTSSSDIRHSTKDSKYLELAKNPEKNKVALREMVDDAAKKAGYSSLAYHGTNDFGFTKIDPSKGDDGFSFFVSKNPDTARSYSSTGRMRDVYQPYLTKAQEKELLPYYKEAESKLKTLNKLTDNAFTSNNIYENAKSVDYSPEEFASDLVYMLDVDPSDAIQNAISDYVISLIDIANNDAFMEAYLNSGVYSFYINKDGLLSIDAKGSNWNDIKLGSLVKEFNDWWISKGHEPSINGMYMTANTRAISEFAKEKGYSGVEFNNIVDMGKGSNEVVDSVYSLFRPQEQVKSADLVTYDDQGNVIPLSERFRRENNDIRFSTKDYLELAKDPVKNEAELQKMVEDAAKEAFPNSVLIQGGNFKKVWHHTNQEFNSFLPSTSKMPDGLKGIFFASSANGNITSKLGKYHNSYFLNVENFKLSMGNEDGVSYANRLAELQKGVSDRNELARINEQFRKETGIDAFLDPFNGWWNVLSPESIKSADPVTYDDNGNIIPLSERFNINNDIRYSTKGESKQSEEIKALREKFKEQREEYRKKITKKVSEKYAQKYKDKVEKLEDRQIREKITKHTKELSDKLLKPNDQKHIPENLRVTVAATLNAINQESTFDWAGYSRKRAEKGTGIETQRTKAFKDLRLEYRKILDGENNMVIDPDLLDLIEKVEQIDVPLAKMNHDELMLTWNTIKAVEASVFSENKLFKMDIAEDLSTLADSLYASNFNKKERTQWNTNDVRGKALNWVERTVELGMMTPQAAFHRLGNTGDYMFRSLRATQDEHIKMLNDISEDVKEILKDFDIKTLDEVHQFNGVKLTTGQLMSLYELYKREQGKQHILIGGIRAGETKTKGVKAISKSNPSYVKASDLSKMFDTLSSEQKKLADTIQKYMAEDLAEIGNNASMEMYGYRKFTEKNYFPIQTDKNQVHRDSSKETGVTTIASKGITKALIPYADNAVIVNDILDVLAQHATDMSYYGAWLGMSEDLRRVLNYRYRGADPGSVRGLIERVMGKNAPKYFNNLLDGINQASKSSKSYGFDTFMGNYKAASVAGNIRVVIQQPTAILRALAEIDSKYLAEGAVMKRNWEEVKEHAPIAIWKDWGNFDIGTGKQLEQIILGNDTTIDQIKEKTMEGASKADSFAWSILWNSVKAEVSDTTNLTGEEYWNKVSKRFEEIVDKTQVVDGVLQRSDLMRSKNALDKMATSFMAEPTKVYNMVSNAVYDYAQNKDGKKLGKAIYGTVASFIVNAAVQSIIDAMRNDDKDKEYWRKYLESYLSNFASNFNPAGYIPYIKDVASVIEGYDVTRMDMDAITKTVKAVGYMSSALAGTGKMTIPNATANLIAEVSRLLGVPVANLKRDLVATLDTIGSLTGSYVMQYYLMKSLYNIKVDSTRSMYYDMVYAAYKKDKEAYAKIRKDMIKNGISGDKIDNAIKNRIKKETEK